MPPYVCGPPGPGAPCAYEAGVTFLVTSRSNAGVANTKPRVAARGFVFPPSPICCWDRHAGNRGLCHRQRRKWSYYLTDSQELQLCR